MPRTIDQQIAEAENRVQRLKTKKRIKDTRRKIIVGATVIPAAFKDKALARQLVTLLETSLTRAVDIQDAEPLSYDLSNKAAQIERKVDDAVRGLSEARREVSGVFWLAGATLPSCPILSPYRACHRRFVHRGRVRSLSGAGL